jgi:hypothetical protein
MSDGVKDLFIPKLYPQQHDFKMSNGGSLAASTRYKPDFLDTFVLLAVRHHR